MEHIVNAKTARKKLKKAGLNQCPMLLFVSVVKNKIKNES